MLFVFDWDGTILNSTAKIVASMHSATASLGLSSCSDEAIRHIIGLSLPEAVRQLYPQIDDASNEALRRAYSAAYLEADQQPCDFFPGVLPTLETLRDQGYKLAIATGKSRRGLNRVLANLGLENYFDASRCADETRSKPDPRMVEELLHELEVAPRDSVMVGDTDFDLMMANNAGIKGIGVSYGAQSAERLAQHKPLTIIDDFRQLLDWERQLFGAARDAG